MFDNLWPKVILKERMQSTPPDWPTFSWNKSIIGTKPDLEPNLAHGYGSFAIST